MTTLHTEVLNCPFCAGAARVENDFNISFWVQCDNDHSDGGMYKTTSEAIQAWNTRTPQPDAAAIRKQFMDDLLNAVSAEMAEWTGDFRKPVTTAFSDMLARLQFTTLVEPVTDHIRDATKMIPDGYVLVPVEPTEAMIHAAEDVESPRPFGKVYRAMIAAASTQSMKDE